MKPIIAINIEIKNKIEPQASVAKWGWPWIFDIPEMS